MRNFKLKFMICTLFFVQHLWANGGGTSANSLPIVPYYKVIPFKHFIQVSGLPPKLYLYYELKCNQSFVQVLRFNKVHPRTGKLMIVAGGLVSEDIKNPCVNLRRIRVDAGETFSGRVFELQAMNER